MSNVDPKENYLLCRSTTAFAGDCVKTPAKFIVQKTDRIEPPTSDFRHMGNGFGTLNNLEYPISSEFPHTLAAKPKPETLKAGDYS